MRWTYRGAVRIGELHLAANLRIRLWFENSKGEAFFGEGIAGLLQAIEKRKSISRACKEIGMSYRYALHRFEIAEKRSGMTLVRRFRGGGGKGGRTHTGVPLFASEILESKAPLAELCEVDVESLDRTLIQTSTQSYRESSDYGSSRARCAHACGEGGGVV